MNQQTMAATGVARSIRRPVSPVRVGLALAISLIVIHALGGNFANEWEGWGVAVQTVSFAAAFGALALGLTFGILVRRGLRTAVDGRNRPARAALLVGVVGILSYVIFFTGAPAIVGAGAITLGLAGLRLAREGRGRRGAAVAGLVLGAANVAFTLAFYAAEMASGILEHWA
jgi:hypothetical protein